MVPSYGKTFGDNPLPGQTIVLVAVVLTVQACFQFVRWQQQQQQQEQQTDAPSKEQQASGEIPSNASLAVQISLTLLNALLLFMALDTMTTMATLRATILCLLLFLSFCVAIGERQDSKTSTPYKSYSPSDIAPSLHIIWALQTYLLPGMWGLMKEAIEKRSFFFVYMIWFCVFFWVVGALLLLPNKVKENNQPLQHNSEEENSVKEKTDSVEVDTNGGYVVVKDTLQSAKEVPPVHPPSHQESHAMRTKEASVAMTVIVLDLFITLLLQFA